MKQRVRKYIRCRTLRHAWDEDWRPVRAAHVTDADMIIGCPHCTTERVTWIDTAGDWVHRYFYPDDYKLSRDETPSNQEWRLALMARMRKARR